MGFKETLIPIVFFVISIAGIAQSSITIKTYLDTNKEKDTNFNFSAVILAVSIISLIVSGFFAYNAYNAPTGAAMTSIGANAGTTAPTELAGSQTNLGAQEMGLANKLENIAANAQARATKAAEGAKLANALGATLGQLKKQS